MGGWIVQADLATQAGPFELWAKALSVIDRIHGLVNNAGIRTEISIDASASDCTAAWQREFQINLFAAADLCMTTRQGPAASIPRWR
ncbi:SDR family NAD(P)-dependent oxidoreductase [Rhizobium grahamii]|uniref:SDR family NAD(P)-dependent oxidoreductase n=1 Tax=Rhizobium grahamii TaxID=1120045 RepID=UPI002467ECCA|nr:SDR family NAD(P)-dependent oxidoreductase [Rhizobium grahamii]